MTHILEKYREERYALLRIVSGSMFMFHGMQKILGFLSEMPAPAVGSQIWIGGLIELVAGLLILAGFRTRWAAFLASGEMAVAYFQFHWQFRIGREFLPGVNKGELAVLYCFLFLYLSACGSGIWSVDRRLKRWTKRG